MQLGASFLIISSFWAEWVNFWVCPASKTDFKNPSKIMSRSSNSVLIPVNSLMLRKMVSGTTDTAPINSGNGVFIKSIVISCDISPLSFLFEMSIISITFRDNFKLSSHFAVIWVNDLLTNLSWPPVICRWGNMVNISSKIRFCCICVAFSRFCISPCLW